MADLVSYYVESAFSRGPASLVRRRPDPEGDGRVDDHYMPSEDSWRPDTMLRKYQAGRADYDFYGIHPDEADRVAAWLREAVEVGRDKASTPPVLGEWSVGTAWQVKLTGPLSEQALGIVLDRLGMTRRGTLSHWREKDLGLRVLRSDMECRWNFELSRPSDDAWVLSLLYLRLTPDERVIQDLRNLLYPVVDELGLDIAKERVGTQDSWPYSDRAMKEKRPDADWLLVMWFHGQMTEANLRKLHQQFSLQPEWGADLDDVSKLEWGIGHLRSDSTYRAQLRIRRAFNDEDEWRFEIGVEGQRPADETVDQWRAEIMAAATDASLEYQRDWLKPRPVDAARQAPPPPVRTAAQVQVLYRAYLGGRFTAETLDEFRDALSIRKRGRIDDDTEQYYGERVLRDEPNRLVRLMLARSFEGDWYLSLSYQDTAPDRLIVDQLAQNIRAAAAGVGLTVEREWHDTP